MHIHLFIHYVRWFLHYVRPLGSMRFLGMVLFMVLLSVYEVISITPAGAMFSAARAHDRGTIGCCPVSSVIIPEESNRDLDMKTRYRGESPVSSSWRGGSPPAASEQGLAAPGAYRTNSGSPVALVQNHTSFFFRLSPRIFMIPRMNRTPKPKSVYRLFARAPGPHLL